MSYYVSLSTGTFLSSIIFLVTQFVRMRSWLLHSYSIQNTTLHLRHS